MKPVAPVPRASVVRGADAARRSCRMDRNPRGWTVFQTTIPPIRRLPMPPLRSLFSACSVAAALSLVIVGGQAPTAQARAVAKAPAPSLSIESKVCNIGPEADARSATITASAILGDDGDRVSMKFSIQQRQDNAKWRAVPGSAQSGLGGWETSQSGRDGLRYTKTINGLGEGIKYRIVVDARGLSDAGKVVTKTARRYVACTQPLFTPTLDLVRAVDAQVAGGTHEVTVTVRNAGRLPLMVPGTVSVQDAATRSVLGTAPVDTLEGGETVKLVVPIAACPNEIFVTVQAQDAVAADLTNDQSATVSCKAAQSRSSARR